MSELPDDARLREALRTELPAPAHRPGFRDDVRTRVVTLARPQGDKRGFWGSLKGRRLPLAAAAALAACAAAALVLFGLPGATKQTGPAAATAAQVAARMAVAMRSFTTLQGQISTAVGRDLTPHPLGRVVADSRGDFRIDYEKVLPPEFDNASQPVARIFNASRHTLLDTWRDADGRLAGIEWAQCPPGAGFGDETYAGTMQPGLAWMVRAALADGDPGIVVKTATFEGRPAWSATFPQSGSFGFIDGATVVVDQETGLVLQLKTTGDPDKDPSLNSGGPPPSVTTLSQIRVDPRVDGDTFSVTAPQEIQLTVARGDYYCTLDQAAARVGYAPFLPSFVPEGFTLADVATDPREFGPESPSDAAPGGGAHHELFLSFRHGFDAFSIKIAPLTAAEKRDAQDRYAYLKQSPAYRSDVLRGGRFAEQTAQTWFDLNGANLLVLGDGYGALISGSLTRQELLDVAGSLQQTQQ